MTDPSVRVPSAPFSEDLLADLHGGVLDPETSAALWPLVHNDPDAHGFVTTLDHLTLSLAELDNSETTLDPIPDSLAERINSSLDRQWNQLVPRSETNIVPFGRRRRTWIVGAAAAAVLAFVVVLIGGRSVEPAVSVIAGPSTVATPTHDPGLDDNSDPTSLLALIGSDDLGPLDNPSTLAGCRRANGIDDGRALLGSGQVHVDGVPAIVLLFAGSAPRQITALTVGFDCSTDDPDTLSVTDIG